MSSDAMTVNFNSEADLAEVNLFGDDTLEDELPRGPSLDARRKLEERLEELRLQRDLREFDFDV